ncbi:hypothetical protein [Mycolicibacterium fortuitum]|uniref:Uncharacterized protein n=1 Tax=Mycolicibacterium fortuitum subsp. fortuitum DSM 46621 = ATCC 6841 = JCM 6387 TaxID=1214102 RepID=K0V1P8_MYCFO|nr:hypothetical protein [Mycolicibacterium fortuitum]AIY44693.1 hypothetical protein G155_02905 [Mycobacterium sp. VKM Ac-1817D]CRL81982.1 hypothetical protein CPGR_05198 [Mycolicibacter nonchromogenicus]EJZ08818.1 hypothetical protein MFORT_23802 [Mycolicibacterium fortuitum subsp. fortuitum DSM 46621 = ATCC 6841 = JCM 6387]WEV33397.1 hypothetical protein OMF10_02985 [Mycolicibacterium fortuitum]CRL58132.1 hypothetical protein CPGR_05473 [Mycolicibacterium fortuitum subsp. fortuitum DSM 46621
MTNTAKPRSSWLRAAAVALAFTALPGAIVLAAPAGTAAADVCASAGRRISVGGCVNIADAVAPYVPPPTYYAPLPEDPPPPPPVSGCVGYNGRWVHASGCN